MKFECDEFDRGREKCRACKDAVKLINMMKLVRTVIGLRGWAIIDAHIDRLVDQYGEAYMVLVVKQIDIIVNAEETLKVSMN